MARRSSSVAVQPVGLVGELRTIAVVRGVTLAKSRSRSSVQPSLPSVIGTGTGVAPEMPMAAVRFGQAGCGISTSSPVPDDHAAGDLDGLHAAAGDEEALGRERLAVGALVIAGERGAQLRDAALMGIEGLAGGQRLRRRIGDEVRRRQVAFADPERDQPLAPAAVVEHFDDAAFRRVAGFAAQGGNKIV